MTHLTEGQIKHMVDRFLGWRLPENFNPDAGISFKKTFNEHTAHPMKHEPIGTNLFDAEQATAMVRYMIAGLPSAEHPIVVAARAEAEKFFAKDAAFDKASFVDGARFAVRRIP